MSGRKRATTGSARRSAKIAPQAPASEALSRRKITLYFREALLQEARSAVLALGANGLEPSNLSRLFEAALERELERLRREYNRGQPFPPYRSRLPGGRPRRA
jgi:hypothetical protein